MGHFALMPRCSLKLSGGNRGRLRGSLADLTHRASEAATINQIALFSRAAVFQGYKNRKIET
jgi:hypothetical protein